MNTPEKIANNYFRLNGFFLLPQFTLFTAGSHIHVDLLGLRPPGTQEVCEGVVLPIDMDLFAAITEILEKPAQDVSLGIIAEVKGNQTIEVPLATHLAYTEKIFGPTVLKIPISISDKYRSLSHRDGCVRLPLKYALEWILYRFRWMDQNLTHLTKSGSWNLSEEILSDLLYLQKIGFASLDKTAMKRLYLRE